MPDPLPPKPTKWASLHRHIAMVSASTRRDLQKIARLAALLYRCLPVWAWAGVVIILIASVLGLQNVQATKGLKAAHKSDDQGQYVAAKTQLMAIRQFGVLPTTRKQIHQEEQRNQQLTATAQKLAEVQKLLKEHKTQAAEKLLQSIGKDADVSSDVQAQITQLQKDAQTQASSTSTSHSTTPPPGSTTPPTKPSGGGTGGGGTGGSSGGGSSPAPGPMTSISIVSFTASATPNTASTCNIGDSVTFSSNGSGSVTTTWSLLSTKTVSEITNPQTFTFSAAGTKSDSFPFNLAQGLEPGDSYRVSVVIASASNPAISAAAGPIIISSCAAPPGLVAEKYPPFMTTITPGVPSVYQRQDATFPNGCEMDVTTPYSVNSSGTVEAIVMLTSSDSIGYTYYDYNGATVFSGPGSANDTSYMRIPHLPSGGRYTITVKLVEVSSPNTVYAITSQITSACD